ncbi:MAG: GSCFA domain-containing protein [Saprospiraceae bacterium]|nr:GSCFA domain-containing protein [Saprospiraceae bacterium]
MSSFRTVLPEFPAPFRLGYTDRLMLLGSCFTENISARLQTARFSLLSRPFGTVYNPISMARCLNRLVPGNQPFNQNEIFENAGLWRSWEHHSDFAAPEPLETLRIINTRYDEAAAFLKNTNTLLLTLGTADVHMLKTTGQVVANNHKMPAEAFETRRMTPEEVAETLGLVLEKMPHCRVVLTVSPVRHLRLGLHENQLSKSVLLLACDMLVRNHPNVFYFPAYELQLDDLRDYRFYTDDMIHPAGPAVEYIWKYFSKTFFSAETQELVRQLEKLHRAVLHRPFHPDTPEHQAFKMAQLQNVQMLEKKYPFLNLQIEKTHFSQSI